MTAPATRLAIVALALAAGCGGEPRTVGGKSAKAKPPADPKAQPRDTLNKTTQDVYEMKAELAKGAQLADLTVDVSTPVIGAASAYSPLVAKMAAQKVEMDLNLYHAQNERYPASHQEFLDEIIRVGKPDGVQLPMLPYYREYSYDVENHKLVVLEYPERKAARDRELKEQGLK